MERWSVCLLERNVQMNKRALFDASSIYFIGFNPTMLADKKVEMVTQKMK
jgi:hypothetical protein